MSYTLAERTMNHRRDFSNEFLPPLLSILRRAVRHDQKRKAFPHPSYPRSSRDLLYSVNFGMLPLLRPIPFCAGRTTHHRSIRPVSGLASPGGRLRYASAAFCPSCGSNSTLSVIACCQRPLPVSFLPRLPGHFIVGRNDSARREFALNRAKRTERWQKYGRDKSDTSRFGPNGSGAGAEFSGE